MRRFALGQRSTILGSILRCKRLVDEDAGAVVMMGGGGGSGSGSGTGTAASGQVDLIAVHGGACASA